jgi:hypothetical protein
MQGSQITLAFGLHMPCMGEQKQGRHAPTPTKAPPANRHGDAHRRHLVRLTWRMQEILEKIDAENRVYCAEQGKRERERAKERALLREDREKVHQERAAALQARSAETKAMLAEMHGQRARQVGARRLARQVEAREQKQQGHHRERAQRLEASLAARERRMRTGEPQMTVADRLTPA